MSREVVKILVIARCNELIGQPASGRRIALLNIDPNGLKVGQRHLGPD